MDDLTPHVSCRADEIEEGDQVANLGVVRAVFRSDDFVMIEFHGKRIGHYYGNTYRNYDELVREAREYEIDSKDVERRSPTPGAADLGGRRAV